MTNNHSQENTSIDLISFIDVFEFLWQNWITISAFTAAGVIASVVYLNSAQQKYEAIAQVLMAQVSDGKAESPAGINIEDPNLLVTRLRLPSTYTEEAVVACSLDVKSRGGENVADMVKAVPVKNVPSMVEIHVQHTRPELAQKCATALFEMVKLQQTMIVSPLLDESRKALAEANGKLAAIQNLIAKSDKTLIQSIAYLAIRDEINYLKNRIDRLRQDVILGEQRKTRLAAPVYASDIAVHPRKSRSLLIGLLAGVVLGTIIAVGRQAFGKQGRKT